MYTDDCFSGKSRKMKKIVFGLLVITAGALLLAFNFDLLDKSWLRVVFSWQMLLIAIGLINLFAKDSWLAGFILISVGGFFLLPEVYDFSFSFTKMLWPLLLIVLGLLILFKFGTKKWFRHGTIHSKMEDGVIEEVNIFGGSKQIITTKNFRGGKMVNIFGGSEIDLSKVEMDGNSCDLEVVCIFGGVSLIVPANWNVKLQVASVMGGFADKRFAQQVGEGDCIINIKGVAILGGGEIKSY